MSFYHDFQYIDGNYGMVITKCDLDQKGDIVIPSGVIGINANAFRYCSEITSITIPSSVISIGEYAFCECTSLVSVNISSSAKIPTGCFKGCVKLNSVNFNSNISTIETSAFEQCTSLNMVLPDTITSVGVRAFHHAGITNLSISENLSSIGDGAFCWCPLESISINSNNTNYIIEDDVLYNTDKTELILYPPFKTDTTFTIPETVTRINKYAFEENYYMEKIRINDAMVSLEGLCGLMNIKEFECYNSDGIVSQTTNGYRVLVNEGTNKGYLFYNEYLCRIPVDETSLAGCPYSFNGCLSGAFSGCAELTEIDVSRCYCANDNEMLPYKCFYKCENLILSESNTISMHGVGIDDYAFAYCNSITGLCLNIDNSSAISSFTFNEYSFYNSAHIINISLSVNTNNIITKTHSFENCLLLTALVFPTFPNSTDITSEKNAFLNTANNQSNLQCEAFNNQLLGVFGVPDNGQIITPISDNKTIWKIWKANPNVASIFLGEGMTKLMGYTFCNSSYSKQGWHFNNLQRIKFPSTLTEIGGYAFYKTELFMSNVNFSNCNNITTIEPYAFYEVKDININLENLRYVGQNAFYYSTFKTPINININDDNSLVVYETNAFYYALGLDNINITCSDIYIGTCLSNISLNSNLCNFTSVHYYNNVGSIANISLSNSATGYSFCGRFYENTTKENYSTLKNVSIISKNAYFYGNCNFIDNYNMETLIIKSENQNYSSGSTQNYGRCWKLKSATISGYVNKSDFGGCYNLEAVKYYRFKDNYICKSGAFTSSDKIKSIDFSESDLTEIDMSQIQCNITPVLCCLKELILPQYLTKLVLSSGGLKGKNIYLPNSLQTLEISNQCASLTNINIPKNVKTITLENNGSYCHGIRKLKVPKGCTVNNAYFGTYRIPIKITYY